MDFLKLKREIVDDWQALASWRREAREDYAFFAGDQWTAEERAALRKAGRVAITFNRSAPIIEAVVGSEINNRTEVRFIPRQLGDAAVNEVLTGAAQWFRDEADAEEEESDSFQDCVIAGLGWTDTRLSTDDGPDGEPEIERVDPFEIGFDRNASARNLRDARRVFRVRRMALDEAKEMFPGKGREAIDATWIKPDESGDLGVNRTGDEYAWGEPNDSPDERDQVTVVQVQWKERERYGVVVDPMSGQRVELTGDQAKAAKKAGFPVIDAKRWVIRQAFLGAEELERGPAPCQEDFTLQCMTGKRDRNNRQWYGLMRAMRDPQKWANKWLVQTLHIMNVNSKGGVMAEADAVPAGGHRDFEEDWAQPDAVHWLAPGALSQGKVQPKPQTPFPAGFQALTDFAISSIPDSTGVNMEMMGLRDANQAGILEYQRKQSALTILAKLFDSLRGYRKRQGRVLLHYITEYLSDGRLVRIAGDDGMRYVPLVRDPNVTRYDVIVDDSPTSPNQKEQTWAFLQQILPAVGKMLDREDWMGILEFSPLPESFVAKMKKRMTEPDPAQQAQAELQQRAAAAEVAKLESETVENQAQARETLAKAAQIEAEASIAPLRAQADMAGAQADIVKARADARRAQFEADEGPARLNLDAFKVQSDAERGRMQGLAAMMRPVGQTGPQKPSP